MEVRIETLFEHEVVVDATIENLHGREYITFPIYRGTSDAAYVHINVMNGYEVKKLNAMIEEHSKERNYREGFLGPIELDYIEIKGRYLRCGYLLKEGDGKRMASGEVMTIYENDSILNKFGRYSNVETIDGIRHYYYYAMSIIEAKVHW